ncbi:MAG: hypothetical protein ACI88G_002154, partial [Woeseiaceae bacterium]
DNFNFPHLLPGLQREGDNRNDHKNHELLDDAAAHIVFPVI